MLNLFAQVIGHLEAHGLKYLASLALAMIVGGYGTVLGQAWIDGRIIGVVVSQTAGVRQEIADVKADVAEVRDGIEALRRSALAREITEVQTLLCAAPGDHRLLDQLERAQDEYERLTARRYSPPTCDILRKR